jgi:hypothetical protein
MIMLQRMMQALQGRRGRGPEGRLLPALAWAGGGGAVVVALGLVLYVLYVLAAAVGGWWAGTPPQAMTELASAPLYRNFVALFLASFLAIFVAREIGVGTRGTPGTADPKAARP